MVRGGEETEGKGGEKPSMHTREREIEMRMGGGGRKETVRREIWVELWIGVEVAEGSRK